MPIKRSDGPDWSRLQELAGTQAGYFRVEQAAAIGFSQPLLQHHLGAGRLDRPLRGIYRIAWYPSTDEEEYVLAWLWSRMQGVVSHESALLVHQLSDALPAGLHLTLPTAWQKRRLNVPREFRLHYSDIPDAARGWFGAAPVTTVERTLRDCIIDAVQPDLVEQALREVEQRGLLSKASLHQLKSMTTSGEVPF